MDGRSGRRLFQRRQPISVEQLGAARGGRLGAAQPPGCPPGRRAGLPRLNAGDAARNARRAWHLWHLWHLPHPSTTVIVFLFQPTYPPKHLQTDLQTQSLVRQSTSVPTTAKGLPMISLRHSDRNNSDHRVKQLLLGEMPVEKTATLDEEDSSPTLTLAS